MDNQKFNVFTSVVDQTMNVLQLIHASIVNVYRFVLAMEVHAVQRLNASVSIITLCVNANQDLLEIQRLDAKLSAAEVTMIVQQIKLVSIRNVKARATKWQFAKEMRFAEFIVTNHSVVARLEPFQKRTDHVVRMMNTVN